MSEYSVEEVRAIANNPALLGQEKFCINAYADLLEQIDRAQDGVTDEVAKAVWNSAAKASPFHNHYSIDNKADLKTALHAVAHLLPSGELKVEIPVCFYLDDEDGGREYNTIDQFSGGRRGGVPLFAHPPAQASQGDNDLLIQCRAPQNRAETKVLLEMAIDQTTRMNASLEKLHDTAEPVAQGEAVPYCERSDCPCHMALADCRHKKHRDAKHRAVPEGWMLVPEDIHPVDAISDCAGIRSKLASPPSREGFPSDIDWLACWWEQITSAAPSQGESA